MLHGETVQSPLPQDIPWWSPDFAIFFGVLYLVLLVIGSGVGYVILQTLRDCAKGHTADVCTHGESVSAEHTPATHA